MTSTVIGIENLSLQDVKKHLYVDITEDDTLIQSYIDASLSAVKRYIHTDVLLTEYVSTATEVENNIYYITNVPKLVKANDVDLTRDQFAHYDGRLCITDTTIDVIDVKAYAGNTTIPKNINQARKLLIGTWYNSRESVAVAVSLTVMPHGIEFLLDSESTGAI